MPSSSLPVLFPSLDTLASRFSPAFPSLFLNQFTFFESRAHWQTQLLQVPGQPQIQDLPTPHLSEKHKLILCCCPPVDFFLIPAGMPVLCQLICLTENPRLPREDPEQGHRCCRAAESRASRASQARKPSWRRRCDHQFWKIIEDPASKMRKGRVA